MKDKRPAIVEILLMPLPDVVAHVIFLVWGLVLFGVALARLF